MLVALGPRQIIVGLTAVEARRSGSFFAAIADVPGDGPEGG
jgi:hypothetical protein